MISDTNKKYKKVTASFVRLGYLGKAQAATLLNVEEEALSDALTWLTETQTKPTKALSGNGSTPATHNLESVARKLRAAGSTCMPPWTPQGGERLLDILAPYADDDEPDEEVERAQEREARTVLLEKQRAAPLDRIALATQVEAVARRKAERAAAAGSRLAAKKQIALAEDGWPLLLVFRFLLDPSPM